MNRIKNRCANTWADYLWDCDRSRVDEALAIVGAAVVAVVALWALSWLASLAGCGASFLGVPFLIVARTAWAKRMR